MKRVSVFMVLLFGLVSLCLAQEGHEPYEGQLEISPDQYQTRPKPHTDEWSYQDPEGQVEKNPYEETGDLEQPDQPQEEPAPYPNETPDYGGSRPWGKGPPPYVPPRPRRR